MSGYGSQHATVSSRAEVVCDRSREPAPGLTRGISSQSSAMLAPGCGVGSG